MTMAATAEVSQAITSRPFNLADLTGAGSWLIPRLKERYPLKNDGQLLGWLRGSIPDNANLFLRTAHAVILARCEQGFFATSPTAVECFVLASAPEFLGEAQALYDDMERWAQRIGASEMQVNVFSDVPPAYLKERFGRTFVRQQTFVRLPPKV